MPRQPRSIILSNFIHIMVQGINKEYIFSSSKEKNKYLNLIKEKVNDFKIIIIAYCIMDNHTHLLLNSTSISEISNLMLRINTSYAKWYNLNNQRVGYVFRDRFLSEPITDYKYLYNCISYIHNNPVKANIVVSPNSYYYSSYNDYKNQTGIFNSNILNLLSLTQSNYMSILSKLDDKQKFKDYEFVSTISPQEIINNFLLTNNINTITLLKSSVLLKQLIILLKEEYKFPITEISKYLNIHRNKIYRILNNK